MSNEADVILRLAVKDEGLQKSLEQLGPAGEKAFKKIKDAGDNSTPSMKEVDAVVKDVTESMNDAEGGAEGFGGKLSLLRTGGVAAAAGLAAVVGGAIALAAAGEKATREVAAIGFAADRLSAGIPTLQALRFELAGVVENTGQTDSLLDRLNSTTEKTIDLNSEYSQILSDINPQLLAQVRTASTLEERYTAIRAAYRAANTDLERSALLTETFGTENVIAAEKLLKLEGGIEGVTERAREQGAVLGTDLVRDAQEYAAAMEQAQARVDTAFLRAKVKLKDFSLGVKEFQADAALAFGDLFETSSIEDEIGKLTRKVENEQRLVEQYREERAFRSAARKERNIVLLNEQIAALQKIADFEQRAAQGQGVPFAAPDPSAPPEIPSIDPSIQETLNRLRAQAITLAERRATAEAQLQAAIDAGLVTSDQEIARLRAHINERYKDVTAIAAQAKAANEAKQAAAELARQEAASAQIRGQLGDFTGLLAQKESQLNDLVKAGTLTRAEATRALTAYREGLDGTTKAREDLTRALNEALDPIARFNAETERLTQLQALANIPAEDFNRILAARADLLDELEAKKAQDAEREEFGESLDDAEKRIKDSLLTSSEMIEAKIAAERKILDALVQEGVLTTEQSEERLRRYREELERGKVATDELTTSQDILEQVLNGQIKTWEDLVLAIIQAIIRMQIYKALSEDEDGEGGDDSGGDEGFFSSFAKFFAGGSNSSTSAGVNHSGTASVGTGGVPTRRVPLSLFNDAQRYHSGTPYLRSDEKAIIAQNGERIISRTDNAAIVAALRNPPVLALPANNGGGVKFTINNNAGVAVTTEERTGSDGSREIVANLETVIDRRTKSNFAGGVYDRANSARYGQTRRPIAR